jgi:hypothetical protein
LRSRLAAGSQQLGRHWRLLCRMTQSCRDGELRIDHYQQAAWLLRMREGPSGPARVVGATPTIPSTALGSYFHYYMYYVYAHVYMCVSIVSKCFVYINFSQNVRSIR